jgi:hypothetical protein
MKDSSVVHFFVGNSWNGGIHSGAVESIVYIPVLLKKSIVNVYEKRSQDLIPVIELNVH